MKKTLLGAAIALLSSSVVHAQDYQFEVGAIYVNGDASGVDYDGFGLSAQLHLDVVNTAKGPLNEAAFSDKSSFANVAWVTSKIDASGAESTDAVAIGGRFVTTQNIILEANYTDSEDDSAFRVGAGTYVKQNMSVVASYHTFDEAEQSTLSLDLHGVTQLKGETALAFDLGFAYLDVSDETGHSISAGADYYIDKGLSIGAGMTQASVGDVDVSSIDVRADYFITPVARLGVGYSSQGQDADGDAIQLNAAMRF